MKRLIMHFVVATAAGQFVLAQGLSDPDRKSTLKYLKDTRVALKKSVAGLSDSQLNFKPSPESWSIAECVEHLAIVEAGLFGGVEATMKGDADPSKRGEVKMSDEDVWNLITNRTNKVKTQERFVPSGQFDSFKGTLEAFESRRDKTSDFVKDTKGDLRNRYFEFPFGTVDLCQVVIFIAGHSDRHTKQIEEVKADPNFPKKKS
jgi:hypothetical protein